MSWWMYALLSAVAASVTAILMKVGVAGVSAPVATAVRTLVVVLFAWVVVVANGDLSTLKTLKARPIVFLILSGIATAVSWLAYARALQLAPASKVAPVDKASLALTIVLAAVLLHEPMSWRIALGTTLIVLGALLTLSHG